MFGILVVEDDAELLSLVWNNLFSNAFKFTEEGGAVSLQLTATEHHAVIKVKDTGCGMSAEVGTHIFEKFYRAHTGNIHDVKGYGLGLYYVKSIVEKHGWTITAESEPGKGTTFILSFRA